MIAVTIKQIGSRIFEAMLQQTVALCVSVLALVGCFASSAAPGDFDPSFGDGGRAAFSFPGLDVFAFTRASILQSNGKLTLAGECESEAVATICALRLLPNGRLDTEFGNDGRVVIIGMTAGYPRAVAYQDDGRLLLGGYCSSNSGEGPCVVRLQANGALDTSFGAQGIAIVSVPTWELAASHVQSVRVLRDGRIAVGLLCKPLTSPFRFCAAQLQSTGALDSSFGVGGVATVVADVRLGSHQILSAMSIDHFDRWVISGHCSGSFRPSFCAVRLQSNGTRDLSYGTNGAFVHQFDNVVALARAHTLDVDGGMILGGICSQAQSFGNFPCVAAITSDGRLDMRFGQDGIVVLPMLDRNVEFPSPARQPDGSLLLGAGFCEPEQVREDFCVLRLRSDGTLDPTWPLTIDRLPLTQLPSSIAVDAQGRIVVSGSCQSTDESHFDQFCAVRFEGGPYANTLCSFDVDGDGLVTPRVDGLILLRATLGFSANSILQGVNFPAGAKRTIWGGGGANDLRQYLVAQCGMSIAPVAIVP